VVLAGDLNVALDEIDVYDPRRFEGHACFTDVERASFRNFLDAGFVDSYRHLYPTRKQFSFFSHKGIGMRDHDRGWRLDYMVISKEHINLVVDSSIHKEFIGSDHCPVQLKLDLHKF
jgi:exodeoxyribonuclease-3